MSQHISQTLLQVNQVKKYFAKPKNFFWEKTRYNKAVDGISFDVQAGETLGIVGESGSGKSTLVRTIAQIYQADAGQVIFEGQDLVGLTHNQLLKARRDMQMIFQDPYASLDPYMTVKQIIAEPLNIYKKHGFIHMNKAEIEDRVFELMQKVGILTDYAYRYPHEFSGGQRQRIGIARALAMKPKLILADEPVSALDVSIQSQVLNLLKDLQQELNLTYVFIAHDLAVVRYICSRVAVMYHGHIVEMADVDELFNNPLHPYTQMLLDALPLPDPAKEKQRQNIIIPKNLDFSTSLGYNCPLVEVKPRHYVIET
jgi:oligopeptide transport system ATP-binding protein